jgi:hypothetical protein
MIERLNQGFPLSLGSRVWTSLASGALPRLLQLQALRSKILAEEGAKLF